MSARDGTVIWCQECGGPWGVLGEGREADLIAAFDVSDPDLLDAVEALT